MWNRSFGHSLSRVLPSRASFTFIIFFYLRQASDNFRVLPGEIPANFLMTTTQAAELRVKWKERTDAPKCEHLTLELEWSENGYFTGNYTCIVRGDPIAQKPG